MNAKVIPISETEQERIISLVQDRLAKSVYGLMVISEVLDFDKYGGVAHIVEREWKAQEAENAEFIRDLERRLSDVR